MSFNGDTPDTSEVAEDAASEAPSGRHKNHIPKFGTPEFRASMKSRVQRDRENNVGTGNTGRGGYRPNSGRKEFIKNLKDQGHKLTDENGTPSAKKYFEALMAYEDIPHTMRLKAAEILMPYQEQKRATLVEQTIKGDVIDEIAEGRRLLAEKRSAATPQIKNITPPLVIDHDDDSSAG